MHDGAELRRAGKFLRGLEKNLASPLTDPVPGPLSSPALQNLRSNNPQETHSAPPPATPQRGDLADLSRRN